MNRCDIIQDNKNNLTKIWAEETKTFWDIQEIPASKCKYNNTWYLVFPHSTVQCRAYRNDWVDPVSQGHQLP